MRGSSGRMSSGQPAAVGAGQLDLDVVHRIHAEDAASRSGRSPDSRAPSPSMVRRTTCTKPMPGPGGVLGLLLRSRLMRHAPRQRLKAFMPGCMLISGSTPRPHHRLRGLLEHVVLQRTPMISCQKRALLQMRVDIDQQLIVVIGQRLPGRLREIVARVGCHGNFRKLAERLSGTVRSSMATSPDKTVDVIVSAR